MIVVLGHNALGHVLHVIVGPESEFFMDIHGAKIIDISNVLQTINNDARVFLSITRTKNEPHCLASLTASGITAYSSFGDQPPRIMLAPGGKQPSEAPASAPSAAAPTDSATCGNCTYCGKAQHLLPISGFKICHGCA